MEFVHMFSPPAATGIPCELALCRSRFFVSTPACQRLLFQIPENRELANFHEPPQRECTLAHRGSEAAARFQLVRRQHLILGLEFSL